MSHHFEIVVFTAAGKEYADAVIDSLADCKDSISHRLYWDHVTVVSAHGKGGQTTELLNMERSRQSMASALHDENGEAAQRLLTDMEMRDISEGSSSPCKAPSSWKGSSNESGELQGARTEELSLSGGRQEANEGQEHEVSYFKDLSLLGR